MLSHSVRTDRGLLSDRCAKPTQNLPRGPFAPATVSFGSTVSGTETHLNSFLQLQTFKNDRKARVEEIKRSERLGDPSIWNRQIDSF